MPTPAVAPRAADRHPHGTRAKYGYGCRCEPCREAARIASREWYRRNAARKGTSLVATDQVRRHIHELNAAGLGTRSIADAAGLDRKTVMEVSQGARARITRRAAFRILRVNIDHAADHSLIDAVPTWALIRELVDEGYKLGELARLLGYSGKTIPFGKTRCSARNANRVRALHEALTGDAAQPVPRTNPYYHENRIYAVRHAAAQVSRSHA